MEWDKSKTRDMQLEFIGSQAQTRLSTHDLDLIQLQAFEPKQRRIEGQIMAQNDHLRKRQASYLEQPVQACVCYNPPEQS